MQHYTVESDVARYARQLGLCDGENDEIMFRIAGMLRESAPITHPGGNRRYEDWLFTVRRGIVSKVHLIKCSNCDDRKRVVVYNDCDDCEGDGCDKCGGSGEKKGMIPCFECTTS